MVRDTASVDKSLSTMNKVLSLILSLPKQVVAQACHPCPEEGKASGLGV